MCVCVCVCVCVCRPFKLIPLPYCKLCLQLAPQQTKSPLPEYAEIQEQHAVLDLDLHPYKDCSLTLNTSTRNTIAYS